MPFDYIPFEEAWLRAGATLAALALVALAANWLTKRIVLVVIRKVLALPPFADNRRTLSAVVDRLSNVVPALVIQAGIGVVPHLPAAAVAVVRNVAAAFLILTVALAITTALGLLNDIYQRRPDAANRPIKGYIQVAKLVIYCATAILMISALIERSPVLLFSGLGAMAAILLLVFKDTILSLVASVQISSNDMVRVGDWVEMPQFNADGDVIDIALHTVKIQNWDKTITTIPTHRLITDSFKNWRGMAESGGRRIKRCLSIDQTTIRFLADDDIRALRRFALLRDYLDDKQAEIRAWNAERPETQESVNARRFTNIGTFRAYALAYLRDRSDISKEMTLLVRQLQPGATGLPLEIYCFTTTIAWAHYEGVQGDIFDHLLAILPEFGLRLFQEPTGQDLAPFAQRALSHAA